MCAFDRVPQVLEPEGPCLSQKQVDWMIKNRGRHALVFPGEVADSEAKPAPHPVEEITNVPLPGLAAPRASQQRDPGPLAQDCDSNAGDLAHPAKSATKAIEQLEWVHQITLRRSRIQAHLGCV